MINGFKADLFCTHFTSLCTVKFSIIKVLSQENQGKSFV